MNTREIVAKLWDLCNVLRDDGITYHQYVTELTYILFLKMAKETGAEKDIPAAYRWDKLSQKSGITLKNFYDALLKNLGSDGNGIISDIYRDAVSNIKGIRLALKAWAICMKACSKKMPMRKNPAPVSISRRAYSLTLSLG